jgi:hypothetical protein
MHQRTSGEIQQLLSAVLPFWSRVAVKTVLIHRILHRLGEVAFQLYRGNRNAVEE